MTHPSAVDTLIPRAARAYITGVTTLGAIAVFAAAAIAAAEAASGELAQDLPTLLLVTLACLLLQVRPPGLTWKGQTMANFPDEALLVLGFALLPPAPVVLAYALASCAAQIALRRPPRKAAFNVAALTLTAGTAGLAVVAASPALSPLGIPPALVVPVVASAVAQTLVAGLLTLLAGEPLRAAFKPVLATSIAMTTLIGVALGVVGLTLHHIHPATLALLLPALYVLHVALEAGYRQENETAARQALGRASGRLVGEPSEDVIVDIVRDVCREAVALRGFEVEITRPGEAPRAWRDMQGDDGSPSRAVSAPLVDRDGREVGQLRLHVAARGAPRRRSDEALAQLVAGHLSIAFDTARTLRSLREAQTRLRDVLNAAPDPIVALDAAGRIVYNNHAAIKLLTQTTPSPGLDAIAQGLDAGSAARLRAALAARAHGETLEITTRASSASLRTFEVSLSPVTLQGFDKGTLLLARDVTERQRLAQEAEAQREAAARAERLASLGILVAGVAHEINNPLTYLQGNIELARLRIDGLCEQGGPIRQEDLGTARADLEEVTTYLDTALSGSDRIARITKALKTVARADGSAQRSPTDLNDVLRNVEKLVRVKLPANVRLKTQTAPVPVEVFASAAQLDQVLLNLVQNAVEAVQDRGGTVAVSCRVTATRAELHVEDTGPGIPADLRGKLFTPFYTTKAAGTGLGLSIVHAIVKDHAGDVYVDQPRSGGTRFRVIIPLAPPRQAVPTSAKSSVGS